MNHFAEQEDTLAYIIMNRLKCNLNRILHPVTKAKVPGQDDLQLIQLEYTGRKIFLQFIQAFTMCFNGRDDRTSVMQGYFK
ncbi:hypothetical protein D3C86_1099970 [compost metagenome]